MTDSNTDTVSIRTLVFSVFLAIAGTVAVLEWQGKITHTAEKEDMALADYKVVYIPVKEDGKYRLSQKPSHQTSFCASGYVFIANDNDPAMQGLLVDYKSRGIKCDALSDSEQIKE